MQDFGHQQYHVLFNLESGSSKKNMLLKISYNYQTLNSYPILSHPMRSHPIPSYPVPSPQCMKFKRDKYCNHPMVHPQKNWKWNLKMSPFKKKHIISQQSISWALSDSILSSFICFIFFHVSYFCWGVAFRFLTCFISGCLSRSCFLVSRFDDPSPAICWDFSSSIMHQ